MESRENDLLIEYTSVCLGFPLLLCPFPVPDFCGLPASPPSSPLPPSTFFWIYTKTPSSRVCVFVSFRGVAAPLPITEPLGDTRMADWARRVLKCCLLPHEEKCWSTVSLDSNCKCRRRKISSVFTGGWKPSSLSVCRGLLCSAFQCLAVAILILNYNCGWQGRV